MYRIYKKIPDSFQGDFEFLSKSGTFHDIHVMSLKEASGRFFFHFREVFGKCIDLEYIGKFLIHFKEILNFV